MSVRINRDTGELVEDGQLRAAGGSTVVTIPQDIAEQAGLSPGDDVEFAVDINEEGQIEIRDGEGGEDA
jgi:antitoxin component of MazEF toxin-antitoxin module